jgi:hypothetical protein
VPASTEPEMPAVALSGQIERVRLLEPLRVAVGRAEDDDHDSPRRIVCPPSSTSTAAHRFHQIGVSPSRPGWQKTGSRLLHLREGGVGEEVGAVEVVLGGCWRHREMQITLS